jgi:Toprim-like
MTPDITKRLIRDIYDEVDRSVVFADHKPRDKGRYLECICPACGKRRAYVYKYGKVLRCNRVNECGYESTLIQYVAGCKKPRGKAFITAITKLAEMAGIFIDDTRYYLLPSRKPVKTPLPAQFKARPELETSLKKLQARFDTSAGFYLRLRGIPVDLAKKFGVGFAPYGNWPHYATDLKTGETRPCRQWRPGRVVFPIRNGKGEIVNLYGRAAAETCPKSVRHDFLPGPKGIFNQRSLERNESAFIVEGYFDALSMIASGRENTAAIFQVGGIRWDLIKSRNICFGFDPDQYGNRPWQKALDEGVRNGKNIFYLSKDTFEGCSDLNELWRLKGRITPHVVRYELPN